ncbi:MAG: SRPBCC family protein [Lysobacterales bacterium]|jgi:hypothetical protein
MSASHERLRCGYGPRLLAAAWLSVCAVTGVQADPGSPPPSEMMRLEKGEVLVETIHEGKSGGAARVTALFHTDAAAIWNIIGYCKYAYVYLKGLEHCQVVKPGLQQTRIRHRLKRSWYTPTLDYTFDASRSAGRKGEFGLVEGNLKVLEGRWTLVPLPGRGGIIVSQTIRIQPRFPTPKWLLRRSLRHDLPDMLACIRGLAGASGDATRIDTDLGRCPGDPSSVSAGN